MPTYVVERYLPRMTEQRFATVAAQTRGLAAGAGLTYVSGTLLVEDEIGMFVLEADSEEAVAMALERAGLAFERITEAVEDRAHTRGSE